jgi:hypothetical protein
MQLLTELVAWLDHAFVHSKLVLQSFSPYKLAFVVKNSSRSTLTQSSVTSKGLIDWELFGFRSDFHLLLTIVLSYSGKSRENAPVAVDYSL